MSSIAFAFSFADIPVCDRNWKVDNLRLYFLTKGLSVSTECHLKEDLSVFKADEHVARLN